MQPEFRVLGAKGFNEAGAFEDLENAFADRRRKGQALALEFCLAARRFHQLHEAQIGFGTRRNLKYNLISILDLTGNHRAEIQYIPDT
jgi:hypothetical protein